MIRIILFFLLASNLLSAQEHIPVFPNLTGDELMERVVTEYKPNVVLSYSRARDTMFGVIDNFNDSLRCVYSGHTIYLDPSEDPTQAAFMGGNSLGINTEHTYPQSMGAEVGNARSDMHHLFPTRTVVNSARGSKIFEEIDDNATDVWFYLSDSQMSIPSSDIIDLFSETDAVGFEPPEDHKGDVARAMFYFYTMYKDFADDANPNYFGLQQEDLCQWHFDDPVDEKEWNRTQNIAKYQDDKANPFIYDCSLAARLYCPLESCDISTVTEMPNSIAKVYPNPASELVTVEMLSASSTAVISIINIHGIVVKEIKPGAGASSVNIDLANLRPGMYLTQINFTATKPTTKILFIQ